MPEPGELTFVAPRRAKPPVHLADLDRSAGEALVRELGEPPYRLRQLGQHYFGRLVRDATQMTDLPPGNASALVTKLLPELLVQQRVLDCDQGNTRKFVWRLFDGARVESVLMRYSDRATVCVSSQAGCGMNCPFCATGQAGLTRNLSAGEIVEQVVAAARACQQGELGGGSLRLSNVVFMGMGEPLANYNALIRALRTIIDPPPDGLGLSRRHVVVSTVGLVPAMDKLAAEDLGVTLAVSLHAPDDELRDTLVPVNTRWPVAEVVASAARFAQRSGRRWSVEYALIRDVNDQRHRAERLAELLAGHLVHVNLIPLNPTPGSRWTASRAADERAFVRTLERAGIPVTVRDTRGRDIDAACGQLAATSDAPVGMGDNA